MERQVRAPDHLTTTPIFNEGEDGAGKKSRSLLATFQKSDRDMFEAPYLEERRVEQQRPIIVMTIEIDEERNDDVRVFEGDEPRRLAVEFCARNGLDMSIVDSLTASIAEQVAGYRKKVDEKRRKGQPTPVHNRENGRPTNDGKIEDTRLPTSESRMTPKGDEGRGKLYERLHAEGKVLQQRKQERAQKEAESRSKELTGMFKPTLATQRRVTPPNGRAATQIEDVGEPKRKKVADARKTPSPNSWRRPVMTQGQTPPSVSRGNTKSPTGHGNTFTRLYQDAMMKQQRKERPTPETTSRTSPAPRTGANTSRSRERRQGKSRDEGGYSFHPQINKNSVYYKKLREKAEKGLSSDEDESRVDYEIRRRNDMMEVKVGKSPKGLNLNSNVRTTREKEKTVTKRAESRSPKDIVVGFVAGRSREEDDKASGLFRFTERNTERNTERAMNPLKPREVSIIYGIFSLLDSDGDGLISAHTVDLSRLSVEVLEVLTDVLCELEDRGAFMNRDSFHRTLVEKGKLEELLDAGGAFLQLSTTSQNGSYQFGRPSATSFVETKSYFLAPSGR
eukprot:TRINITY_DN4671_c0_g1_i1.p1 TRINITY_DN4671_c0_g1~~TRINITY_DN4671_c0_g1_i1.p1  ORF type:complete len:563 (-),score=154.22 TRINITY_DN4671_c0_g1_i1:22-1710(-)